MKKFKWMSVVVFGLLLRGVSLRAETPALRGGAMLSCSGMPCVDVSLKNGKHLKMLLNLGESSSIVDEAAAKDAGLTVNSAEATTKNAMPAANVKSATLEGTSLGGASLGDIPVQVKDIASGMKKDTMPNADGILGYAAFQNRLLQIDTKRQTVRISEPLTAAMSCAGVCGDVTTPTFGNGGPQVLVTTGFAVNGKLIRVQLDTLYTGTMLIYPGSIAKLDLQMESGVNATQFFKYTDGGVAMREGKAHTEAFGSKAIAHNAALFFAPPQVHAPDAMFDGAVGLGLLNGHVLYLDLHSQHFWMTN